MVKQSNLSSFYDTKETPGVFIPEPKHKRRSLSIPLKQTLEDRSCRIQNIRERLLRRSLDSLPKQNDKEDFSNPLVRSLPSVQINLRLEQQADLHKPAVFVNDKRRVFN